MGLGLRRLAKALLLAALLLFGAAHGGTVRYDYDGLGRLTHVTDEQGRVTEYVYDAAGNILQVISGASAQAPAVNSVAPASVRRNRILQMSISGSGLNGVSLTDDDPGISLGAMLVSATTVSFRMTVTPDARLGAHTLTLRNAAGSVSAAFDVLPAIDYVVTPNPLAIPPDNVARQFSITASEADSVAVTVTASTLNPAVARAGATPITLLAGQTQATGTITGVAAGTTILNFDSPLFVTPIAAVVYVTTDFANANVVHTKALGLVKGDPAAPSTNSASGPVLNAPLGVIKGDPTGYPGAIVGPILSPPVGVEKP